MVVEEAKLGHKKVVGSRALEGGTASSVTVHGREEYPSSLSGCAEISLSIGHIRTYRNFGSRAASGHADYRLGQALLTLTTCSGVERPNTREGRRRSSPRTGVFSAKAEGGAGKVPKARLRMQPTRHERKTRRTGESLTCLSSKLVMTLPIPPPQQQPWFRKAALVVSWSREVIANSVASCKYTTKTK